MTDPFQGLREPVRPVDPDPAFAAALRARLERAVLDPELETLETTMTTTAPAPTGLTARMHTLTPRLTVTDARAAVDFYVATFGATRRGDPIVESDGRVGHVEIAIGDSVLMLADEYPEYGLVAPVTRGGATGSVYVVVADPDAVVAAALAAGGTLDLPVTDSPHGRGGAVRDPSGHRWSVSRGVPAIRPGDVTYAAIWTGDVERASRFFGAVLGRDATPDHGGRGASVGEHLGLYPTDGPPTAFLAYAVDDLDVAVATVRAAGGAAGEPQDRPYGRLVDCTDDVGIRFALHEGPGRPAPLVAGALGYVEMRMPDPGRARAFYGSVLGLRYLPGREPGYWHPEYQGTPTSPFAGLGAGPEAVLVATFAVADIDAATTAVRAGGGRAGAIEADHDRPTARCVDDQGMAFGLQQL